MSETPQEKKGNGKKVLLIIFIFLLAAINGVQLYLYLDAKKQHETTVTEKNTEIEGLKAEAQQLLADLEASRAKAEELGMNIDTLNAQIEQLKALNTELEKEKRTGWNLYYDYKKRLEGHKALLKQRDREIAQKDSLINMQKANIDSLNVEKTQLNTKLTELTDERDGLQNKVEIASVLRAENIKVTMLKSNGKEYEKQPFKGKKIDKLKISFNLGKNDVAEVGTKPIAIRLVEPGGAALYDLAAGGGSFTNADGKEIFYSAKQDVMFSNSNEKVNFMYSKGSEYKEGDYTLEIYEGENMIGKAKFGIK